MKHYALIRLHLVVLGQDALAPITIDPLPWEEERFGRSYYRLEHQWCWRVNFVAYRAIH
jgi:hypothetical protein